MKNRKIAWEIVLAGVTFIGIAIFLLNQNSTSDTGHHTAYFSHPGPPSPPEAPFPNTFVIDLQNIENLNNLKILKNLKNLRNLENFKNLDMNRGFGNINLVGTDGQTGKITIRAAGKVNKAVDLGKN